MIVLKTGVHPTLFAGWRILGVYVYCRPLRGMIMHCDSCHELLLFSQPFIGSPGHALFAVSLIETLAERRYYHQLISFCATQTLPGGHDGKESLHGLSWSTRDFCMVCFYIILSVGSIMPTSIKRG